MTVSIKVANVLPQEEGGSELEEVEKELAGQKVPAGNLGTIKGKDRPGPPSRTILSPIFLQAFTLTFLAEWGDRSQVNPACIHPDNACRLQPSTHC